MKVFFDCEFTDLVDGAKLISVGLVSLDCQSLYIELTDGWQIEECSDFVVENVLPHLGSGDQLSRPQATVRVFDWLTALEEPGGIELLCDSPWDPILIRPLLPPKIAFLPPRIEVVAFAAETKQALFLDTLEQLLGASTFGPQHHALADAQALREAWMVAEGIDPKMVANAINR